MKLKVLERFNLLFKVKLWPKFYRPNLIKNYKKNYLIFYFKSNYGPNSIKKNSTKKYPKKLNLEKSEI